MKVLLLAAGRGTRISRYLAGNPKCTVDIGGQKLIQYTIELFHKRASPTLPWCWATGRRSFRRR